MRPVVLAGTGRIQVAATPEFSYLESKGKKRKSIVLTALSTEVMLEDGVEAVLGGGETEEESFRRFFAGYDRQRRVREVEVRIRARVVEPPP